MAFTSPRNTARVSVAARNPKPEADRPRPVGAPREAGRPGRVGGRPRATHLGADFETFARTLRRAVVPCSPLENVLTDRLILAAWRLQLASSVDFENAAAGEELSPLADTRDAESSLEKSLELLELTRADRIGRDLRAGASAEPEPDADDEACPDRNAFDDESYYSNEWVRLPDDHAPAAGPAGAGDEDSDEAGVGDDDVAAPAARWQDRLVFDFNVSETSPVVKGTWITVSHVVSLIVDGWAWSDVLRTHPELTEDDVRVCLAYTVEQDSTGDF